MTDKEDVLDRIAHWPDHAKEQLLSIAREIDDDLQRGVYEPTAEELEGIDAGLAEFAAGRVVEFAEIERLFETYRTK